MRVICGSCGNKVELIEKNIERIVGRDWENKTLVCRKCSTELIIFNHMNRTYLASFSPNDHWCVCKKIKIKVFDHDEKKLISCNGYKLEKDGRLYALKDRELDM